jgi:hypothetical protein
MVPSPPWLSATAANLRCTATECSARARTPRTSFRRPFCAPGANASSSKGDRRSGRGCMASQPTAVSTRSSAARAALLPPDVAPSTDPLEDSFPPTDIPWLEPYPDRPGCSSRTWSGAGCLQSQTGWAQSGRRTPRRGHAPSEPTAACACHSAPCASRSWHGADSVRECRLAARARRGRASSLRGGQLSPARECYGRR